MSIFEAFLLTYAVSFLSGILIFVVLFLGLMALGMGAGFAGGIAAAAGVVSMFFIGWKISESFEPR
jgi:hypothetical protein